jgi:hypothetical protein
MLLMTRCCRLLELPSFAAKLSFVETREFPVLWIADIKVGIARVWSDPDGQKHDAAFSAVCPQLETGTAEATSY